MRRSSRFLPRFVQPFHVLFAKFPFARGTAWLRVDMMAVPLDPFAGFAVSLAR